MDPILTVTPGTNYTALATVRSLKVICGCGVVRNTEAARCEGRPDERCVLA